ncbi:unnamed protein product [Nezara viridula]|uniref:Uncharacterized protein n=1 Tax=Nezara viridula TaxID=85310 RepID=A0A9P0HRA1_NEZVI|nr:unnamed protein product [Nezara viridula]
MSYKIYNINGGYFFHSDEDILQAKCTSTLIKGKKNVVVNTMAPWDDGRMIASLVLHEVDPKQVAVVVSTNGSSSYIGNNHMFKDCIHIIGNCIQRRNVFLPDPFREGKPYLIDEDDLKVIPTPGRTLDDVSVVVKTEDKGTVVIAGDLFIKEEDIEDESIWLSTQSECPNLQRSNREMVLNMANHIIPGYGLIFEVTAEKKKLFYAQRPPFRPDPEVMAMVGIK